MSTIKREEIYKSPFLERKERLFENKLGFVIFDKYPVSKGHCLIVPNRVYSDYFESTNEEIAAFSQLLLKTKEYLDSKYKPLGYNIGINIGEDSGQTIWHVHIHIIPRYKGDVENPRGGIRNIIPGMGDY
jgi:diadenosine tetraphosphate (Ap4A) HIT family hydrolase